MADQIQVAEVELTFEKATKRTYRFQEESNGQPPRVGTLYVQQWAFGSQEPPQRIKVTVEIVEA